MSISKKIKIAGNGLLMEIWILIPHLVRPQKEMG